MLDSSNQTKYKLHRGVYSSLLPLLIHVRKVSNSTGYG
jgi:hypothetical protein